MKTLYISYFGAMKPLVQTQVIPYLRLLREDGHEVWLVTFEEALANPTEETRRRTEIAAKLERDGIHWHPLRYHKRPSLPATMYDVAVGISVASALVLRHRIDVIHARNHVPGMMALVVRRMTGCGLLFDMRGVMAEEYVDAGVWQEGGLPYRIIKAVEKKLFQQADSIVMLTERIRDLLREREPILREKPIEVIPCCADLARYLTADGRTIRAQLGLMDRRVMVYAGSTNGWYMLDEMAQLAKLAADRDPRFHFLFLTHTPAEEVLAAMSRAGLEASRCTVRAVEPSQMPEYLAAADFALTFIRATFSKLSSSPTKIGEYLAAGLPILSNRGIGDVDALLEGARVGVLLDAFDDASYRRALDGIDALKGQADVMDRCRATAEKYFSLDRVGRAGYRKAYAALARRAS